MTASHFTPRLALPYPDENDPADVPLDIQNLAVKLDTISGRAPVAALAAAPVLDVGLAGQIRAGRQLVVGDFAALQGLSAPAGLWNLSDLTDSSGWGRALTNKGAVPFGVGINGQAATAAQFAGSTAQAFYIVDAGAADPFRLRTGSWGCWARTGKLGAGQCLIAKRSGGSGNFGYELLIGSGNNFAGWVSPDGATIPSINGTAVVADDRWHHAVMTYDGGAMRLYVDGALDLAVPLAGAIFPANGPFSIGAEAADGATAGTQPFYGRIDEAFVTADVLSLEQVRSLYAAKLPHTLGLAPSSVSLGVRRAVKGGAFALADFPTQPLRLHNFTAGALTDQGLNNVPLVAVTAAIPVAGADGLQGGAFHYTTANNMQYASTDAALPAGVVARSYGAWIKQGITTAAAGAVMGWGTLGTGSSSLWIQTNGVIQSSNAADTIAGPAISDGRWHLVVATEDNAAADGVKRKLYLDGRLIAGSTVLTALVLAGANHFRVGANPDGSAPFTGDVDAAFVCGYALTGDQIRSLYAKGTELASSSPKNAGDHVETMDAANVYAILDTLDSQHSIDLGVVA